MGNAGSVLNILLFLTCCTAGCVHKLIDDRRKCCFYAFRCLRWSRQISRGAPYDDATKRAQDNRNRSTLNMYSSNLKPSTMTSPHHGLATNVVSCLVTSIAVAVAPREQHQREHPKCGCERGFSLRYFNRKLKPPDSLLGLNCQQQPARDTGC